MKKLAMILAAMAGILLAMTASAVGPGDKGIQLNYGATPLNNPFNGLPAHAQLASTLTTSNVTGNDFASPLRLGMVTSQGGSYSGTAQTAFPVVNATTVMRGQGQGVGYWHAAYGYGKGNAGFGNAAVNCYGGGETQLPSSTPYCGALGEFDAVQGSAVFSASLTTPISTGATTLHYTGPTHNEAAGSRLLLNKNHVSGFSGTISGYTPCQDSSSGACSVTGGTCWGGAGSSCTVITLSGATLSAVSDNPQNWCFKSIAPGGDDFYSSGPTGDDVSIGGKSVGHWYQVRNVPDNSHIELKGVFDSTNLSPNIGGGTYLLLQCIEATAVDNVAHTFTVPSNTLNWASSDLIYSPPSHYQGLIGSLVVLTKTYKTGASSAASYGYAVNSNGTQPVDYGVLLNGSGGFRRGVEIENLSASGNDARGVNIDASANYGVVYGANSDSTHVALAMGTSGQCQLGCASGGTVVAVDGKALSVAKGIDPGGGGKKIWSGVDTVSLAANTKRDETITWTNDGTSSGTATPFRGTTYSPICVVEDPSKSVMVVSVSSITANGLVATVWNTDSSGHNNFTVHCYAEWRGN